MPSPTPERGAALLLVMGALVCVLAGALVLGGIARGVGVAGERQRAADLAALAGARAMRDAYPRVFEPPFVDGRHNSAHLERAEYLALGRRVAVQTARRNGVRAAHVAFPVAGLAPVRVRVTVGEAAHRDSGRATLDADTVAEAELVPPGGLPGERARGAGEYGGPLELRQGKPMRPDVARAFDRMAAAARQEAGLALVVTSGFRSDAEQARLFAAHPDPKWVAPPGTSLHRYGTELDLGPPAAYAWLAANSGRFGFVKRYSWEPWHFGYTLNAGSRSVGFGPRGGERSALPSFVPAAYHDAIARAARRWNVGAALLAAQLYVESGFNPFAHSSAGAQGIAQFMPGTAAAIGLDDPFDAAAAIDAQAHLMRDLLRRLASVPLALAAYNAGEGAVSGCMCIPPYPETRAYVAKILGLLGGAGDLAVGFEVRLAE
jgi:soluble lytic murein transglycosylase-like protein